MADDSALEQIWKKGKNHEDVNNVKDVINHVDHNGFSALKIAIRQGHLSAVRSLVAAGVDVNLRTLNSTLSPTMLAARKGDVACLQALIDGGARVNDANQFGHTALMFASNYGYSDVVRALLQARADVNATDNNGKTALMFATQFIKLEKIRTGNTVCFMTVEDCVIKDKRSEAEYVQACISSYHKRKEIFEILLEAKACPNKQDNDGNTVLMHLTANDPESCYNIWTDQMVITIQNDNNHILLVSSCQSILAECCCLLLKHKADVNLQNVYGRTALMNAVSSKLERNVLELFISSSTDVNMQDVTGTTLLMDAAKLNLFDCCEILIQQDADVNIQDFDGRTALMLACVYDSQECCDLVITHTDQMNLQDTYGKTALMLSVLNQATVCAWLLVNQSVDVNIQDENGKTALMHATDDYCLRLLLYVGANMELRDNTGCTALVLALKDIEKNVGKLNYDAFEKARTILENGGNLILEHGHRSLIHMVTPFLKQSLRVFYMKLLCPSAYWPVTSFPAAACFTLENFFEHSCKELIQLIVCNGVLNRSHIIYHGLLSSPIILALFFGHEDVAKYFIAACYLTHDDTEKMRLAVARSEPRLKEKVIHFLKQALSHPWPLVKLAFIAVSSALGDGPEREERILQTQLPARLQRILMFQEGASLLPVRTWPDIPLCFDPVDYEKLPKPRPLLYNWPVGKDVISITG